MPCCGSGKVLYTAKRVFILELACRVPFPLDFDIVICFVLNKKRGGDSVSAANQEAKKTGAGGGCERTTDRMEGGRHVALLRVYSSRGEFEWQLGLKGE